MISNVDSGEGQAGSPNYHVLLSYVWAASGAQAPGVDLAGRAELGNKATKGGCA